MTPGPTLVLRIPESGNLVKINTIGSGNTFGARCWTDGKLDAPMLPDQPWMRRHPATGEFFWTDECEEVARREFFEDEPVYPEVPFAEAPSLADYRHALALGLGCTPEKKRYLLQRYWWCANDPVRLGGERPVDAMEFVDYLTELIDLLDTQDPDQRLSAADAARQIRDITLAAELLEFRFPDDYAHVVAFIRGLVAAEDAAVHEIIQKQE
jgi:hypothetical protein